MPRLPFRKQKQSATVSSSPIMTIRRSNRRVRRLQVGLVIGVCVGLFIVAMIVLGSLNRYESRLADLFYRPRTPTAKSS